MKHLTLTSKQLARAEEISPAHVDFALALVDLYISIAGQAKKEET